jgi:hypothetical protein
MSVSTSFSLSVDSSDPPTDATALTVKQQIADSLSISSSNILSFTIVVLSSSTSSSTTSSVSSSSKYHRSMLSVNTQKKEEEDLSLNLNRRKLASSVWQISFNIVVGPSDVVYTSVDALASGVSSTLQSSSFATELSTAMGQQVSVSGMNVQVITRPPTNQPTVVPTLPSNEPKSSVESASSAILIAASIGVALFLGCSAVYFKYTRESKFKKESSGNMNGSSTMNIMDGYDMDMDIIDVGNDNDDYGNNGDVEMKTMEEANGLKAASSKITSTLSGASSQQYDSLNIEYKTELKLYNSQDTAFTLKGK